MLPLLAATLLCAATGAGPHARRAFEDGGAAMWVEKTQDGGLALAMVNLGKQPAQIDVIFSRLGLKAQPRVLNVSGGQDWGIVQGGFAQRVNPGESIWFRLLPDAK